MTAVLAFDCAGAASSAVVWRDGRVLARQERAQRHGQAEVLMPMIQAALAEAGLDYGALSAIATTTGPGSFTGLRVGLAAARGLALATGLRAVGVSTFEAAAHAVTEEERRGRAVLAAIDSRRDEIFVQSFDASLAPLAGPATLAPDAAAAAAPDGALVLTGDATAPLVAALAARGRKTMVARGAGAIDAAIVAALAAARLGEKDLPALRPLYLRPPDTTPQPARRK